MSSALAFSGIGSRDDLADSVNYIAQQSPCWISALGTSVGMHERAVTSFEGIMRTRGILSGTRHLQVRPRGNPTLNPFRRARTSLAKVKNTTATQPRIASNWR